MSYNYLDRLERTIKGHEEWRLSECLNMIASENRSSQLSRHMFATDVGNRYTAPDRFYRGTRYLDELIALTQEIARKTFNARYADVSPLSGHTADMAVLFSLTKRGDKILSVSPENGGYPGISHLGFARIVGLQNLYFPFNDATFNISTKEARALIKGEKPQVVFFGSSFIPFPHPTKELSSSDLSPTYVYDGSHVLGLIAGGEFQDPLREGCSLLIGSTHKSLPGPQGGVILSNNEEVFSKVSGMIFPGIVDNIHLNRVAALAVAMLEMLEFGKAYAQAVVKNSQSLARGLHDRGLKLKGRAAGFSKSHQVLLDYDASKLKFFAERLEQAGVIIDNGGRVGTTELTRMGFGVEEMDKVAELMSLVMLGKKPVDFVKKQVRSMAREFREPKYVLNSVPKALE